MNVVILKGNVTRDPEIKVISNGSKSTTLATFTLAVSRTYSKTDGTKVEDTTFVACEAWDTGAETLGKYVKKGDPLLINGTLKTDSWEKDGEKRSRLVVRLNNFELLWRKPKTEDSPNGETSGKDEQF